MQWYFDGIREEQFKNMRFRKKDMAVVHKGIFKTEEIRIEKL